MYVLKIDLPTGIAYFTGKKKVVQGCESPGLTGNIEGARFFMDEEEAAKFCKMLDVMDAEDEHGNRRNS